MVDKDLEEAPGTAAPATHDRGAAAPVEQAVEERAHRERGLLAIGLFKLSKALFFFCLGLGALKLVHANVGDLALRVATSLHFDTEGQFMSRLLDKADLISGHQLRRASLLSIGYSVIALIEGIGLMKEKVWAEYLTTILTACALPWEVFELCRRPTPVRAGLLVANLLVLAYLVWFLKRKRGQERKAATAPSVA